MEWLGVLALLILLFCSPYLERVRRLEAKVKRLEKGEKGERGMSKLIDGLAGKRCILKTEDALPLAGKNELACLVLDTDEEWVKVWFEKKKGGETTLLLRIENIEAAEVLDRD